MESITQVKLEIFIPEAYIEMLRDELGKLGAGRVGHYDHCLSITTVRGYWRPLEGTEPFEGQIGRINEGTECKVEVNCSRHLVPVALKTIRQLHPYEEPLINIVPLVNDRFESSI